MFITSVARANACGTHATFATYVRTVSVRYITRTYVTYFNE